MTVFGRGENPRNFVAADDVAIFAVMALEDAGLNGQTIDIGGPQDLTNMNVVRLYEELGGRPAKVSHVPLRMLKVMYRLLQPFHPGLSQIMQFSIYADMSDSTFDTTEMLARFPMDPVRLEPFVRERAGKWQTAPAAAGALELDQA